MSAQDTFFSLKTERIFDQKAGPLVMGVLNVTPDSFFDGGKYTEENRWIEQATRMIAEGAQIIDIGAYSTRPGANDVSTDIEAERLLKVIFSVRQHFPETLISADTFRSDVAEAAVKNGANIINDISGGTLDPKMFETIARLDIPYVLMHIKGTPKDMQVNPEYGDVVTEILDYFSQRIDLLKSSGFKKIILDPGFGFGKTLEHNIEIMKNLEKFTKSRYPLLVGISRKSIVNKLLNISSKDALNGTTILNTIALQKCARIIRVHDVKEAMEVVKMVSALEK
jgi:dihydropteroate synthase